MDRLTNRRTQFHLKLGTGSVSVREQTHAVRINIKKKKHKLGLKIKKKKNEYPTLLQNIFLRAKGK